MCGRFVVPSTTGELLSAFDATGDNAAGWQPSYSVAPTNLAPIVREWSHDETVTRDVDLAAWGLKPGWAKPGGPAPINARLESVASNGMFRSAFTSQRCLVPMAGYFEWQQMVIRFERYQVVDSSKPSPERIDVQVRLSAGSALLDERVALVAKRARDGTASGRPRRTSPRTNRDPGRSR